MPLPSFWRAGFYDAQDTISQLLFKRTAPSDRWPTLFDRLALGPDAVAPTVPTALGTPFASTGNVSNSGNVAWGGSGTVATAGQIVFVTVVAGGTATAMSIADSLGNTWNASSAGSSTATASTSQVFWSKLSFDITSTDTYMVTRTAVSGSLWCAAGKLPSTYSATLADSDVGNFETANRDPLTPPLVMGAGGVAIIVSGSSAANTFTAGSNATLLVTGASTGAGNPRSAGVGYRQSNVADVVGPQLKLSTGNAWSAAAVVFALAPVLAHPWLGEIGDSTGERKTTTAAPPTREADTRALFLAEGCITADASMWWWCKGGKDISTADTGGKTAAQNLADMTAYFGGPPDILVVGLITNEFSFSDSDFTTHVTDFLNLVSPTTRVLWVNAGLFGATNSNALHFNPLLLSATAAYPNVTVLDWNTYIHSVGVYDVADWNGSGDAAHMTAQGWVKRDQFIADAINNTTITRTTSDTAAATDVCVATVARPRAQSDTAAATDTDVRSAQGFARAQSDTGSGSDANTRTSARARAVADTAAATDAVGRAGATSRGLSDTAAATDATARSSARTRAVSDTAPATDVTAAGAVGKSRSQSDTASGADTLSRTSARGRALGDAAPAVDTGARATARSRTASDTAPATDVTGSRIARVRAVSDTAAASDVLAQTNSRARAVTDTALATDTVVGASTKGRGTSDTAPSVDGTGPTTSTTRSLPELAPATDLNALALSLARALLDLALASDTTSATQETNLEPAPPSRTRVVPYVNRTRRVPPQPNRTRTVPPARVPV